MRLSSLLLILLLFIAGCTRHSQFAIDTNTGIADYRYPNEPTIAVAMNDNNKMAIAANMNWFYRSDDGGNTWNTYKVSSSAGVWGDPCLVSDEEGNFYLFHLSAPNGYEEESWLDRIVCQKWNEEKKTLEVCSFLGDSINHKWKDKCCAIYIPKQHRLAAAWTEFDNSPGSTHEGQSNLVFSYSDNEGKTWSLAQRINNISGDCSLGDSTATAVALDYDVEGNIYAVWPRLDSVWIKKFDAQKLTWDSTDNLVSIQPNGWRYSLPGLMWCNGWPSLAVDHKSSTGKMYCAFGLQHKRLSEIVLMTSDDEGKHWGNIPLPISRNSLYFPCVRLNEKNGEVAIFHYALSTFQDTVLRAGIYVSSANGQSFTHDIYDEPYHISTSVFMGDYISMATAGGAFYTTWTARDNDGTHICFRKK
ncbi:MAG: sialidase family protein [Chitinophagales bacterium]